MNRDPARPLRHDATGPARPLRHDATGPARTLRRSDAGAAGALRRTPLRVKLVAAVLGLVLVALVLISVATTVALRSYLLGQADDKLTDATRTLAGRDLAAEAVTLRRPVLPSDVMISQRLPSGFLLYGHDLRYESQDLPPVPADPADSARLAGTPYTAEARNGSTRWRMLVTPQPDGSVLTVAVDVADVDSAVTRLVWIEVLVGGGVLALLAALGVAAVRTSLRPLSEIEATAGAIADGDLTRRVPDPEPGAARPVTEVGRLARALNAMLTEIETGFAAREASEARARQSEERMRQFVADASHELRTPLTTIRGFAELYRQGAAGSPADAARLVRRIENEAARMGLLVQDLLLLARLDQERPLQLAPVELPVVVTEAVEAARAVGGDRPITLAVDSGGVPMVVAGDDPRLRQVVDNLLRNALTHTPAGAAVAVALRAEPGAAIIEVADQGPGLAPEQAQRVFERFYRVDSARSRPAAGGTGLGLAIVAALVAAHRGTVEVDSTPGVGATFRVRLPLASDPAGFDLPPGPDPPAEPAGAAPTATADSQDEPSPTLTTP